MKKGRSPKKGAALSGLALVAVVLLTLALVAAAPYLAVFGVAWIFYKIWVTSPEDDQPK